MLGEELLGKSTRTNLPLSECSAESMSKLLPSGSKPAMSEPFTTSPAKSASSKGITTRWRHGLSAVSRARMIVRPVFPIEGSGGVDDEIVIGLLSEHVTEIAGF
jgi:hypothetical protein